LSHSSSSPFRTTNQNLSLTQVNRQPTRVTSKMSSCIDHIYVSSPSLALESGLRWGNAVGSGWNLIGSELSSPNLNPLVRLERSFAICYLNIVIKPLCGNLDIFLNYKPLPLVTEFCSRAFGRRSRSKVKDAFLDRIFRLRSCPN